MGETNGELLPKGDSNKENPIGFYADKALAFVCPILHGVIHSENKADSRKIVRAAVLDSGMNIGVAVMGFGASMMGSPEVGIGVGLALRGMLTKGIKG